MTDQEDRYYLSRNLADSYIDFQTTMLMPENKVRLTPDLMSMVKWYVVKTDDIMSLKYILKFMNHYNIDPKNAQVRRNILQKPEGYLPASEVVALHWKRILKVDNSTKTLTIAAQKGCFRVVEIMMDKGAFPDNANEQGQTPLMLAAFYGHLGIINLLIAKGAKKETKDTHLNTALMWACFNPSNSTEVLDTFVKEATLNMIDQANDDGKTPLMVTALGGSSHMVTFLLQKGASTTVVDNERKTVMDYANENQDPETIEALTACKGFQ